MGLGNILFGRKKLKEPAGERLFALSTARVTLEIECGLKSAGVGAVVFKPLSAGEFTQVEQDAEQLLQSVAADSGSKLDRKSDSFGFEWIVVRDSDLEDQVTAVHGVASEFQDRGFGGQLLANATDAELRELSEAPGAHWDAINAFLDEHVAAEPGPRQDVALALDGFSQAAMEARFGLEGRQRS